MFKLRFIIAGICAFIPVLALHEFQARSIAARPLTAHTTNHDVTIPPEVTSLRPNYPYSVIPGGVYSPDELRAVITNDSLVRQHYAGFHMNSTRLVKLTDDRYEYVSFRLQDRVYWTRKKLRIPKGEVLITDGNNFARTRCGNRLSDLPQANTTALQPPEQLLSLPPFSPQLLPQFALAEAPPIFGPAVPIETPRLAPVLPSPLESPLQSAASWPALQQPLSGSPVWSPPYAAPLIPNYPAGPPVIPGTPVPPSSTPPAVPPVPEPATTFLLGAGLVFCSLCYRGSRRARARAAKSNESNK